MDNGIQRVGIVGVGRMGQRIQQQQQEELVAAEVRQVLSAAFKNISQGQKNSAAAEATQVQATLNILEKGLTSETGQAGAAASAERPASKSKQS